MAPTLYATLKEIGAVPTCQCDQPLFQHIFAELGGKKKKLKKKLGDNESQSS